MIIRKAERRKSKLRLALCGVSGSGKTLGAIKIASGMGGKFVFIDTENGSADLYSDITAFDVINISPPFTTEKYIQAIKLCEESEYDTIIIDSLSHAWAGQGGILEQHSRSANKNSYMAWNEVTPKHNNLISAIMQSKCHIIACMRSKAQYESIQNSLGKFVPKKIGLAPVQREGTDYEFTTVLDIDRDSHFYSTSKDRTRLFEGTQEMLEESVGKKLIEWLNDGRSREDVVKEFMIRLDKCKKMDELVDEWRSIYSESLLSDELSQLTALKDKKKEDLAEDIDMDKVA